MPQNTDEQMAELSDILKSEKLSPDLTTLLSTSMRTDGARSLLETQYVLLTEVNDPNKPMPYATQIMPMGKSWAVSIRVGNLPRAVNDNNVKRIYVPDKIHTSYGQNY